MGTSTRVICPTCGKSNKIDGGAVGGTVVCLACGARMVVEAQPETAEDLDRTDVPAPQESQPTAAFARPRTARPVRPARRALVFAAGLIVGAGISALVVGLLVKPRADDVGDLLALKSAAEDLALKGQLEAAHAKYRELQLKGVGRQIKDGLNWDVLERAQVDQDRIYTLLLDRVQAANPPERAIPAPGTGTATRADDPWFWPRVGTGGRAEQPTTDEADAVADAESDPASVVPETAPASPTPAPERPAVASAAHAAPAAPAAPASPPAPTESPEPAKVDPAGKRAPVETTRAEAPTPPRWIAPGTVTDEQVGFAIRRGVDYLLTHFKDDEIAPIPDMTGVKHAGRNALAVYALLQAHRATNDVRLDPRGERMSRMIERMKSHRLVGARKEPAQPVVYARSVRAAALALYNRPQDREVLKEDAEWLIKSHMNGAYSYDDTFVDSDAASSPGAQGGAFDESPLDDESWYDAAWYDARAIFCDGMHDRNGREIRRPLRRRTTSIPPPPMPGTRPPSMPGRGRTQPPGTQPPGTGVPQRESQPGDLRWRPPRERVVIPQGTTPPMDAGGTPLPQFPWDNSNSQYGLLGVWAAAEAGVEVPNRYWESVQRHWETWQFKTGQWGYMATDREGTHAMTCGGVASLWVTYDWLVAPKVRGQVGRETMSPNLQAGMKWLETADNAVNTPVPGRTHYPGYDLFSLERVGLASGFKYLGSHDWYRVLAGRSFERQFDNGAWGRDDRHPDGLIETAFQILFLSHGRHPILMNKLRFTGGRGETITGKPLPAYWSNRPRDVANLTRHAAREFERPFNWQVVDLSRPWHDWLDAPVLFIASHTPPAFTDADFAKLRAFAEAGGLIFTHADAGTLAFTRWVTEELIPKTFPGRKAELLPDDDAVYTLHYDLKKPRPQLYAVGNGSRLLLVHSPTDLAAAWQQRADKTQTTMFRLGVHLFLYAAGKSDFRNRIDSPYVPAAPEGKQGTVSVARVKYDGDWDPEPGAWRRFANLYQWEMDTNVPVTETDFAALDATKTPVAHLTGNRAVTFTEEQAAAVRKYVESGGVLFIDACGGSKEFDAAVREVLVAKAFPGVSLQPIPKDHPLLAADDGPPLTLRLRAYAADKLKTPAPPLEMIKAGKGSVIVSRVDITTGLLGTNTLTTVGYDAPLAQAVMWNLLGWAGSGPTVQE